MFYSIKVFKFNLSTCLQGVYPVVFWGQSSHWLMKLYFSRSPKLDNPVMLFCHPIKQTVHKLNCNLLFSMWKCWRIRVAWSFFTIGAGILHLPFHLLASSCVLMGLGLLQDGYLLPNMIPKTMTTAKAINHSVDNIWAISLLPP